MPGPEECFESKQALNARFRESNRNISPIEKDYHTNLKECKNDILFIAYFSSSVLSLSVFKFHSLLVSVLPRIKFPKIRYGVEKPFIIYPPLKFPRNR